MSMLTWITEKELQREIKKENFFWKSNMKIFYFLFYFISFLFFMRNVSGQQGAASKVKMNASGKKKKKSEEEHKH